MIKENQKHLNRLLVGIDALSLVAAYYLAWVIRFQTGLIALESVHLTLDYYVRLAILVIPGFLLLYNSFDLYAPYRYKSLFEETRNIFTANLMGLLLLITLLYILKQVDYSRYFLAIFVLLSVVILTCERAFIRYVLRSARRKGLNIKHILLVGYSDLAQEFIQRVEEHRHWGYEIACILDDDYEADSVVEGVRFGGGLANFETVVNSLGIDEVFITLDLTDYDKLGDIIAACEKSGVRTQIVPDYYKYIPARPYVEELDGLPVINIRHIPLDNIVNKVIKRAIDIIGSLFALILFSPVMLVVAILVKCTSPGPVIYRQERVGMNRRPFNMYKFRSMYMQPAKQDKTRWTVKGDSRVTPVGSFIRRTSIDELPQLVNVLRGEMSLVGPRPERPYFVDIFKEEIPKYMVKHQVRPGITGWAQVNGWRGDTSIKKRIEHDIYYIENWSLWFDFRILVLTIIKGFINKNAY
ncbi:undecaprenyl-phosphate glucose phosphotransferase [Syntrophomonas palmitatica]|uniref:undecaprenyl-phosphate glucose phosphotransferase n=1 Tax=Syntrophomonas palmitatica TaxID=402877 RepID=UPI0006CF7B60|nr:undecaprenyl-phosphate glucose phosphotransferase [Syntrophomonas palmitatica]